MRLLTAVLPLAILAATPACSQGDGQAAPAAPTPDAATLGDPNAPVRIVEYASTTCPHCADFHTTLFGYVKEKWIDTGQAHLTMRVLPTAPAELSVTGSLLARCAGPERYFDVLGELFTSQDALIENAQAGTLRDYYEAIGGRHGVSPDELGACLNSEEGVAQINASIEAARAAGVTGTPGFIINGEQHGFVGDLETTEAWDEAMDAALTRAPQ